MYRLRHVVAVLLLAIVTNVSIAQQPPKLEMVVQTGRIEDSTRGVAISGDGKLAIIGSWNGTVSLWDVVSGNRIQTYATPNHVTCVALTRDSKRAIACGATGAVLLDTATGKTLQTLKGRPYFHDTLSVALSDDARFALMSAGANSSLWDLTTGKAVREFTGAPGALSGDGKLVLIGFVPTGQNTGVVSTLWNALTGEKLRTLPGRAALALSRDGKRALTQHNKEATLWDTATGVRLHTFAGHEFSVTAGALSGDGKLALTYSTERNKGIKVMLWDADGGKQLHTLFCDANLHLHFNGINQPAVSLSDDGKFVFVAARQSIGKPTAKGRTIQRHLVWETARGKKVQTFQRHTSDVASLALSGDGKVLLTGTKYKVNVWDTAAGKRTHMLDAPGNTLALTRDGKRALTGTLGTEAVFWDTASGKKLESLPVNKQGIRQVGLSSDGKSVITTSSTGPMIVWHSRAGKFEQATTFFAPAPMALSGDGKRVYVSRDSFSELWDVAGGKQLGLVKGPGGAYLVSNDDGTRLLTITPSGTILWDIDKKANALTAKKLQSFSVHARCLALSRDAKLALSGSNEKTAILWDAANGKKVQTFAGHSAELTSVAMTDDAKRIWTSSADGTVRLWDPATGKELCQLVMFKDGKEWLAVSPDGLFDGSADAWRFVTFREPGTSKLLDDDATRRRFHRPGLLGQIIAGKQPK